MARFSVGQRVRIIKAPMNPMMVGYITTITGPAERLRADAEWVTEYGFRPGELVYPIDFSVDRPGYVVAPEEYLEPYGRDDGHEKASWTDLDDWVRKACFSGAEEEAG